jgi:shikimate 5-dehydrogenase
MALPYLERYGVAMCRKAIRGAAYEPFETTRKNGSKKRHDGWHLIFDRGADAFEEWCNKSPQEDA